jgi:hypothetical protein
MLYIFLLDYYHIWLLVNFSSVVSFLSPSRQNEGDSEVGVGGFLAAEYLEITAMMMMMK